MQSIAKMTKIEQAHFLSQKFFVKDVAEVLEISPRTVRGYIYRTRHPERYAARVQSYVERHRGGKKKAKPEPKVPSNKKQAVERAVELKRKKRRVFKAAPKADIRAEIAKKIKKVGK